MNSASPFSVPLPLRLSGSALKLLALVSMIADHCAYFLLEHDNALYELLRCFGRIAFPIFAFLVAEGFANSRNRLRYFLTLVAFGLVSELPWYLLNGADDTHNVMFTLALGVGALAIFDRLCEHAPIAFLSVMLTAAAAWWLGADYEWRGILMIAIFYMLRRQTIQPWVCRSSIPYPSQNLLQLLFAFPLMAHYSLPGALLASAPILLYDGARGFIRTSLAKYAFYAAYPAHLLLIAACT